MTKRIVDYDPFTGMTTTFDYDFSSNTTYVGREQDFSLLLDANKALQNDESYSKQGIKSEWWHMAKIPNIVIEKWKNEKGIDVLNKDHWPAVKRLLNDPEYRWLKTTAGYI
jgi:hypothetical protein